MGRYAVRILNEVQPSLYAISVNGKSGIVQASDIFRLLREDKIILENVPKYRCVDKIRDKRGIIVKYIVQPESSKNPADRRTVDASVVKESIKHFKQQFTNLTLTTDGRLVSTSEKADDKFAGTDTKSSVGVNKQVGVNHQPETTNIPKTNETEQNKIIELQRNDILNIFKVQDVISKNQGVQLIDLSILGEFTPATYAQHKNIGNFTFALGATASKKDEKVLRIVVLPASKHIKFKLPRDCRRLFYLGDDLKVTVKIHKLSIKQLDWSSTVYAEEMFYQLDADELMIEADTANNLKNMYGFCKDQTVKAINFDKFNVPNLEKATAMFRGCENLSLFRVKLRGISLQNAKFVGEMFRFKKHDAKSKTLFKYQGTNLSLKYLSDKHKQEELEQALEQIDSMYNQELSKIIYFDIEHNLYDYDYDYSEDKYHTDPKSEVMSFWMYIIYNEANSDKQWEYCSSKDYRANFNYDDVLALLIAKTLGWSGYSRNPNQQLKQLLTDSDLTQGFIFTSETKRNRQSQNPEDLNRAKEFGDENRPYALRKIQENKIKRIRKKEIKRQLKYISPNMIQDLETVFGAGIIREDIRIKDINKYICGKIQCLTMLREQALMQYRGGYQTDEDDDQFSSGLELEWNWD